MFDERRQTTVKGIDRSYPLEPLENKPRKQANGNGVQKNGNLTVNRQSVTVKRVARADVNSNLNGGKPVVSYHEEITRESFGPSARQHEDDEFGNENHVARYANGNHRDEVTRHCDFSRVNFYAVSSPAMPLQRASFPGIVRKYLQQIYHFPDIYLVELTYFS